MDACDYVSDFIPDGENESISSDKLKEFKDNAYSMMPYEYYKDYYKRTPIIAKLYFSNNEDTELSETTISSPEEYSTIRAKLDSSQPTGPQFAIQAKIYTVKTFQPEGTPPNPGPVAFNRSIGEPKIDRQKFVALIPDAIFGGYYAKFIVNENVAGEDPARSISTKSAKKVKTKSGKTKTEVTWPDLVKNGKDNLKESISIIINGYAVSETSIINGLYLSNDYFKNKNNPKERNILGCFNNVENDYDNIIIPKINKEAIISGGMQWVYTTSSCISSTTKPEKRLFKNQADWFIVFSHGSIKDSSGGIAIAKEDGTKDFVVRPWDIINNIGTSYEISKYSEDMDVLFLLGCRCLSVNPNELQGSADDPPPPGYSFAWGWNKVLPKGLILGYYWYSHDRNNRELLISLNKELNKLTMQGKKATNEWIIDFWKEYNKKAYVFSLTQPDIIDSEGQKGPPGLRYAQYAAYIYNGQQIQYKLNNILDPEGKIIDIEFEEVPTNLNK